MKPDVLPPSLSREGALWRRLAAWVKGVWSTAIGALLLPFYWPSVALLWPFYPGAWHPRFFATEAGGKCVMPASGRLYAHHIDLWHDSDNLEGPPLAEAWRSLRVEVVRDIGRPGMLEGTLA